MSRSKLALAFALVLLVPSLTLAQQESRSASKGASTPLPITGTVVDADHNALDVYLRGGTIEATITGADGAIEDGANDTIRATVKDYTNSNPLTTILVDTNGDPASIGGGTQYTEDAAAAANPVGTATICVRRDTLSTSEVSADGDNVACKATNKGEIHVKHTDAIPVTDNGTTLSVDDGGASLTVDGTVAATQSGTWNITNVSGTVSLPTGAATAAKQPALGTAGTASTDVITIQGITSMTPISTTCSNCSGSGVSHTDDAAFTPATSQMVPIGGMLDDTTPDSINEGDAGVARMSANRNLYTTIRDAAGNERGLAVDANGNIGIVQRDAAGAEIPAGTAGNGAVDSGTRRVTIANDSTGVLTVKQPTGTDMHVVVDSCTGCGGGGGAEKAEDAAHVSADTGMFVLGVRNDTGTVLSGANGDYTPIATTSTGAVNVGGAYATALGKAEDAAHTSGDTIVPAGCRRIDTAASSAGTSGDYAMIDCSPRGAVYTEDAGVCAPKHTEQVPVSTASSGNVELVALTSGQTIYICDFTLMAGGTVGVQLIYGTGTACATGETNMSGVMPLIVNAGWTHNYNGRLKTAEANAFCIELSAAVQVDGILTYRKVATF